MDLVNIPVPILGYTPNSLEAPPLPVPLMHTSTLGNLFYCCNTGTVQASFGTAMSEKVSNPDSPLHSAAGSGGVDEVSTLTTPDSAITPLHSAAGSGDVDEVSTLTAPDSAVTPLHRAAGSGGVDEVSTLTAPDSAITPLHSAARSGGVDEVSTMTTPDSAITPLHSAAESGDVDKVSTLTTPDSAITPLHSEARSGDVDEVSTLTTPDSAVSAARSGDVDEVSTLTTPDSAVSAARSGDVDEVSTMATPDSADSSTAGSSDESYDCSSEEDVYFELSDEDFVNDDSTIRVPSAAGSVTPLHHAARSGDVSKVRELLEHGEHDVNSTDLIGRTPLHCACWMGHLGIVRVLVSAFHADLAIKDYLGATALMLAAGAGHEDVVRILITDYPNPILSQNKSGRTVLHYACRSGNVRLVRFLIEDCKASRLAQDYQKRTPLSIAASLGKREVALFLISKFGWSRRYRDHLGRSLLHSACEGGDVGLVQTLIEEYWADVSVRDNENNTILHVAALCGRANVVLFLIDEAIIDLNVRGHHGRSVLHSACQGGNIPLIQTLIHTYQADVKAQDNNGKTPINVAVLSGKVEAALGLIDEFSCDPSARSHNGRSLLHDACEGGNLSLVKILIPQNFDVHAQDNQGNTPLNVAALCGNQIIVLSLINEFGCDPNMIGHNGRSLLHDACEGGNLSLVEELILKHNLSIHARDHHNNTPLLTAVSSGAEEVALSLINKFGCDRDVSDSGGKTVLHYACQRGSLDLVQIIIQHHKVDVNAQDSDGQTPLHAVLSRPCDDGDISIVETLVKAAAPDSKSILARIHRAALNGEKEVVVALIERLNYGTKVNSKSAGTSLLHCACLGGNVSLVKTLIQQYKADLRNRDYNGRTPVQAAVLSCKEVAIALIENFSDSIYDIDQRDKTGRSMLHEACECGNMALVQPLINKCNADVHVSDVNGVTPFEVALLHDKLHISTYLLKCGFNINTVDTHGRSPLHKACAESNLESVRFLIWHKADVHMRDGQSDMPLHIALMHGTKTIALSLINEFDCNKDEKGGKGYSLLHSACIGGNPELVARVSEFVSPLETDDNGDTPLHVALLHGQEGAALALISKFGCNKDVKGQGGRFLLHSACIGGNPELVARVSEFVSPLETDDNGDTPLHVALLHSREGAALALISKFGCNKDVKGQGGRSLLHSACIGGNAKLIARISEVVSPLVTDHNGDTPLHSCAALGHGECVKALLDVKAPVLLRNSSGKTPSDLAIGPARLVLEMYMISNKDSIYAFYDVIKRQAKKKYAKPECVTRIFVIGNAGVGKSSFVEAFKKEGFFDGYWRVSESSVPPHTAGIVPSIHTSKRLGRVLFFDFAGDPEYYSSHAAILENLASSNKGDNIFIIMVDLRKESTRKNLNYWRSFIQYQNFTTKNPYLLTVGSHSDMVAKPVISRQTNTIIEVCTCIQPGVENKIFMLNCCQPKSRQIKKLKEEIADLIRSSPRCELSFEASILLGLLEKDFSQVTACPLQTITSHILATGIRLPTDPESLTSLLLEIHDIGLLFLVGKAESGNLQVVLNISHLTNKVHQSLFSKHALEGLRVKYQNEGNTSFFNIGIIPESLLPEILPEYITKECLVHLQYCQEISHGDIVAFPSLSQTESFGQSFLFFPALCKEDKGDISLKTPVEDRFSIGWLARCTGPHDYFPPRFLHVLLLRLVFRFTLSAPSSDKVPGVSFDHIYYQRGCTMWKTGVHWLMEEGVECMVELVNDNREVVIATNSIKNRAENCTSIFIRIISCVMEAKAEFCRPFKPDFFLLDSADLKSSLIPDNLYDMEDVERVLSSAEGIEVILSVSRRSQMDVSKLLCMHKLAHWYSLFPIGFTSVLQYLRDIVKELYELGQHLDISPGILDAIDTDFPTNTSKRRKELVRMWLNSFKSPGPPCWWQLVEALKKTDMRVLAEEIRNTYCKSL